MLKLPRCPASGFNNRLCFRNYKAVVLNKINGRWKIVQDWDIASIGDRPITAKDFARQPYSVLVDSGRPNGVYTNNASKK